MSGAIAELPSNHAIMKSSTLSQEASRLPIARISSIGQHDTRSEYESSLDITNLDSKIELSFDLRDVAYETMLKDSPIERNPLY